MPMTNQKRIWRTYDDQIMHAEKRDRCSILLENDVIAGIDRSDSPVRRVSAFVFFEIIRDRVPASDVVPIEARLDDKNAVGFFHDRVIEGDARQFTEALTQDCFEISRRAQL